MINQNKLVSAVIREARAFAVERLAFTSLWRQAVEGITPNDRMSLLLAVADEVMEHRAPLLCLVLIIDAEPLDTIVTRASLQLSVLIEPTKTDLLAGPRFVHSLALAATDLTKAAAIYAGLLLMGDRRVSPLLHQCWRRLDRASQKILSTVEPEVIHASMVDFFIDWLEDVPEEGWGHPIAALARLPSVARYPEVRDVEWRGPSNANDRQQFCMELTTWGFPEYGQRIAPRIRALMEREREPKVLPIAAAVWGIIKEDDPALQRGSPLSFLPLYMRTAANAPGVQEEGENAEQGATVSLRCGANPAPGLDWTAAIRLVEEQQPDCYSVWQTNARDKWARRRAHLCGSPPWRVLATCLANEDYAWCMNIKAPKEFESSGLERWQDTAVFLCWFRENGGRVNHGAQFQALSDEEVQQVCAPYSDPSDWRREKVIELWDNLSQLLLSAAEDPTSTQLKDLLDQLGCWNSPDPVLTAIERRIKALKPEASTNETLDQPLSSGIVVSFGWLTPQDTRLGIHWENIADYLTLQNWSTKALVRKGCGGWLYLWVAEGRYVAAGATVFWIRTDSEGGWGQQYEKGFSDIEHSLAYANGKDGGCLATETSPATSVTDYPPQREAEWHIHSGR